ncbi:hypothetical protein [Hyphomonas sp.]|uniref:hypothetical protein n=1 Tax=Hyphomonas sp. TaxID=87 RepID=UPI003528EE15
MSLATANLIATLLGLYFAVGAVIALGFVAFGAGRIDPDAKAMPLQARLLVFPGAMGLWPLILLKLFTQKAPPIS